MSYKTVYKEAEAEQVIQRSRFITHVSPVDSYEEAQAYVAMIKEEYKDATHNVPAVVIGEKQELQWMSDDGEPQGTAGQPMLNVFQREGVENVCCVVTRYFGGVLLGAGGLVRAYTQSAKDALDAAGVSVVRRWVAMEVPCTYAQFEGMRREVAAFSGVVEQVDYGADVVLSCLLPEERSAEFAAHVLDVTAGGVEVLEAGERFQDVPWRAAKEG